VGSVDVELHLLSPLLIPIQRGNRAALGWWLKHPASLTPQRTPLRKFSERKKAVAGYHGNS